MRPSPYATFHPDDAARIGVIEGGRVTLTGKGGSIEVDARVAHNVPRGFVLVLADMPEAPENRLLDESGFGRATAVSAGVKVRAAG
jgi:formate dehydrogenase major subunit